MVQRTILDSHSHPRVPHPRRSQGGRQGLRHRHALLRSVLDHSNAGTMSSTISTWSFIEPIQSDRKGGEVGTTSATGLPSRVMRTVSWSFGLGGAERNSEP